MVNIDYNFHFLGTRATTADVAELTRFSNHNKKLFNLPSDIDLLWVTTYWDDLRVDNLRLTFEKVGKAITNTSQVIVLWGVGSHLTLSEAVTNALDELSRELLNPIVYFPGALGAWPNGLRTDLSFTISLLPYFEYEASLVWPRLDHGLGSIREKKFTSIGTKDYPNRKFLLSKILQSEAWEQGYVGYRQLDSAPLSIVDYTTDQIVAIEEYANKIDHLLPLAAVEGPLQYHQLPRHLLTGSYLNMITDTFYVCEPNSTFVSEKVFGAIANRQLFIMMSPPYTLSCLRELGYKTFGDYINEDYDTIGDNYDRLIAVTDSFMDFVSKPIEEISDIYNKCLPIIEHNLHTLYSTRVPQKVLDSIRLAIELK